ncbi:MAG: sigma-70 family RNA polymerase sigma factor [Candidatus Paceibacterota bacterium]|jgi:RNA polymerase sigma-70 factor (ECF subfamily)
MADFGGKELTIEDIVRDYLGLVYSFVFRLTGEREEASDMTQEVFVKVWKNLDRYNKEQNLKTWILAIARNTAIDWLRKKRPLVFSKLDHEGDDGKQEFGENLADSGLLQDEIFAQKELREKLDEIINLLTFSQREVFLLHLEDSLTFEEISKLVGRPTNTVKSQYRRALIALRGHLS